MMLLCIDLEFVIMEVGVVACGSMTIVGPRGSGR
jgi:hypothetical protein